jgi:uncharacterized membrane protein
MTQRQALQQVPKAAFGQVCSWHNAVCVAAITAGSSCADALTSRSNRGSLIAVCVFIGSNINSHSV